MENRDLASLYQDIEIDEPELLRYRQNLEESLLAQEHSVSQSVYAEKLASIKAAISQLPMFFQLASTGMAMLAVVLFFRAQMPALDSVELAALQNFVARHGDETELFLQAKDMQQSELPLLRLNGLYLLTSLGQGEENILASAKGLIEDPRAEFRAYYLEYLLTNADEAYYNIAYVESLIDREHDPECLELLYELLSLAESWQRA